MAQPLFNFPQLASYLTEKMMVFDLDGICVFSTFNDPEGHFGSVPLGKKLSDLFKLSGKASEDTASWLSLIKEKNKPFALLSSLGPKMFKTALGTSYVLRYHLFHQSDDEVDYLITVATPDVRPTSAQNQLEKQSNKYLFLKTVGKDPDSFRAFVLEFNNWLLSPAPETSSELLFRLHTFKGTGANFWANDLISAITGFEKTVRKRSNENSELKIQSIRNEKWFADELQKLKIEIADLEAEFNNFFR